VSRRNARRHCLVPLLRSPRRRSTLGENGETGVLSLQSRLCGLSFRLAGEVRTARRAGPTSPHPSSSSLTKWSAPIGADDCSVSRTHFRVAHNGDPGLEPGPDSKDLHRKWGPYEAQIPELRGRPGCCPDPVTPGCSTLRSACFACESAVEG